MNTEALRQMIRVLEAVKANELQFDLSSWISDNAQAEVVRKVGSAETFIDATKAHVECGTSACACGFAASDEWFIKQGFRWIKEAAPEDAEHIYLTYRDPTVVTDTDAPFEYIGWSALYKFFDMSAGDVAEIFDVSGYVNEDLFEDDDDDGTAFRAECAKITPQDVINKIRTYLK